MWWLKKILSFKEPLLATTWLWRPFCFSHSPSRSGIPYMYDVPLGGTYIFLMSRKNKIICFTWIIRVLEIKLFSIKYYRRNITIVETIVLSISSSIIILCFSFKFIDFDLTDDDTCKATIRMFLQCNLVQQFQIPYHVRIKCYKTPYWLARLYVDNIVLKIE